MNTFSEMGRLLEVIKWLALLSMGLGLTYYRTNAKLQDAVRRLIVQAEATYGGAKMGGVKFEWVCSIVHSMIPAPLCVVITKPMIERLVQSTFDAMAAYAKMQLDELLDSTMPDIERTGDSLCLK